MTQPREKACNDPQAQALLHEPPWGRAGKAGQVRRDCSRSQPAPGLTRWPGGTGNPTVAPESDLRSLQKPAPHSSTFPRTMSEILLGDGRSIRGHWGPDNKDGTAVPGEDHPKGSSILLCVLHALLLACYLPHRSAAK